MRNGLGKVAKTLIDRQIRVLISYVERETRFPERNRVIVLLSFKAGFRAKEIGSLTWKMVTDAEGAIADAISLENTASKGKHGGRVIPMHTDLHEALKTLHAYEQDKGRVKPDAFVVTLAKGNTDQDSRSNSIHFLFNKDWFKKLGFSGAIRKRVQLAAIADGGRLSHLPPEKSRPSVDLCVTSKLSPVTVAFRPPNGTSIRIQKHKGG